MLVPRVRARMRMIAYVCVYTCVIEDSLVDNTRMHKCPVV